MLSTVISFYPQQLSAEPEVVEIEGATEEWVSETRLVPQEVWEDEPVERVEHRTVEEDRPVPQVKGLYAFSGQGMIMAKGEVRNHFHNSFKNAEIIELQCIFKIFTVDMRKQ